MKMISFLMILFSFQSFAANTDLMKGPVFTELCKQTAVAVTSSVWAINRPQIEMTEQGFFFTGRDLNQTKQWNVNFSSDGQTSLQLGAYELEIRDLLVVENNLWILFNDHIIVMTAQGQQIDQIATSRKPLEDVRFDKAYEMKLSGNKVYIAHGSLGLAVIDVISRKLEKNYDIGLHEDSGHWSQASGISILGDKIYISANSVTVTEDGGKAFGGLIVVNLNSPDRFHKISLDEKKSGILSQVLTTQVVENNLVINNWGLQHSVSLNALGVSQKSFALTYKSTRADYEGKSYNLELLGDLVFNGKEYFACGKIMAASPDSVAQMRGLSFQGSL